MPATSFRALGASAAAKEGRRRGNGWWKGREERSGAGGCMGGDPAGAGNILRDRPVEAGTHGGVSRIRDVHGGSGVSQGSPSTAGLRGPAAEGGGQVHGAGAGSGEHRLRPAG